MRYDRARDARRRARARRTRGFAAARAASTRIRDDHATDREAIPEPQNPLGHRRHRVHRVRHLEAAGAGRRARDDGLPADRAAPLARGRALPAGHDERHRERAARRRPAHRAAGRAAGDQRLRAARARRAVRAFAARSSSARGRFPSARRRWSSTSRPSTASARASSTSSTATTSSRSTTSTSARSRRSTRTRRRSPACTSSASSSTSAPTAPPDWVELLQRSSSASARCPTRCASASCRAACCCESPCRKFFLQLIEPEETARFAAMEEHLQRIGLGTPDVLERRREPREARRRVPRHRARALERARRAHQAAARQRDVRAGEERAASPGRRDVPRLRHGHRVARGIAATPSSTRSTRPASRR